MKILLFGKDGQLGWQLQRSIIGLGAVHAYGRAEADFQSPEQIAKIVRTVQPNIIINAAAYTAVDKAESEADKAQTINAETVQILAQEAQKIGAWLIHYSTDYVFDGTKGAPYTEDDTTNPLSIYGQSKRAGELAIADNHDKYLIFRTSWLYAAMGHNFAKTMLKLAKERDALNIINDQHGAPTSAVFVADATALIVQQIKDRKLDQSCAGLYHLSAQGSTSWYEYACYIIDRARKTYQAELIDPRNIQPIPTSGYPTPAPRPLNSRLNTKKLTQTFDIHPPDWHYHVDQLIKELYTLSGWNT